MSSLLNWVVPSRRMAAHRASRHGTPDLMDHSATGLGHPPSSLDAIETLKAVQGLINTYLANGGGDGRSAIPTPEPSPVPTFMADGKRDVGVNGGETRAMWAGSSKADGTVAKEQSSTAQQRGVIGSQLGTNVPEASGSTSQVPQTALDVTAEPKSRGDLGSEALNTKPNAGKMESGEPATGTPNGNANIGAHGVKTPPRLAVPGPNHDRIRSLVDEIARNVSQLATDDAARIKVTTAALELAATVRPPGDTIMGWFANMSVISAVRLFLHWGAFAIIPSGKGETITYTELARRINAEEALLVRVASMLTSAHILHHHPASPANPSSSSLSHTPTSLLLLPSQPMSAMFSLLYTNITHASTILPSYFDTYGRSEPLGPAHIPTSFLAGHPEEDYFSLLRRDPVALKDFGVAMRMTSRRVPVTGVYDMDRVLELAQNREAGRAVWVDVGGGDGHTVGEFLSAYPKLKAEQCVVQDLEEVVSASEEKGEEGLKGVVWVGMDFLKEAPVAGALVYYLRHIMRDYSDPVATTILRNIARAMTDPDSRVLISEQLSPDVSSMPGPLPLYAAFKDFSMLSIGGKERSLKQFAAMADAAGLRVSGVFRDGATPHAVVELALKESGVVVVGAGSAAA